MKIEILKRKILNYNPADEFAEMLLTIKITQTMPKFSFLGLFRTPKHNDHGGVIQICGKVYEESYVDDDFDQRNYFMNGAIDSLQ